MTAPQNNQQPPAAAAPSTISIPVQEGQQMDPQVPQPTGVVDTNNGFIVGVDSTNNQPTAADILAAQQSSDPMFQRQHPNAQQQQAAPVESQNGRLFTEAEVGAIRTEEKNKLYSRIEALEATLKEQEAVELARVAAAQEAQEAADAARRAEELAAMSDMERVLKAQEDLTRSVESLREDNAQKDALLAQEIRLRELSAFTAEVMQREEAFIMPELRDLVGGNSEEEILRSIEMVKQRTSAIVSSMQEAAEEQRRQSPGVSSAGAPPVGPMEQSTSYQTYTAEDISNMDMATYIANRDRLLRASSPNFRG